MLGKTHMVVGVSASLCVLQPQNIRELIIGVGASVIGSVISDIDIGTSESHKEANRIIFASVMVVIAVVILEAMFDIGIYQKIMSSFSAQKILGGMAGFLIICAFGKEQPHRSFMHSFLALFVLTACVEIFFPMATPYFGVAFFSHLFLDAFNKKEEELFFPYKKGFCLGLCTAKGIVNSLLFRIGSCCMIATLFVLVFQMIKQLLP